MAKEKLTIERYFSKPEKGQVEYNKSNVEITDEAGKLLFVQEGVEYPKYFSPLARKIVSSRYFYGEHGTLERENSYKDLIGRVTDKYGAVALKDEYFNEAEAIIFKEELKRLNEEQRMSYNSPVWFNVGNEIYASRKSNEKKTGFIVNKEDRYIPIAPIKLEDGTIIEKRFVKKDEIIEVPIGEDHFYPQTSACFIQGVEDTMEDIMRLAVNEAMLFKYGSGTGTDLSTLRSSREKLSGGGKPSGPLAYLVHYDKLAGIVKSGGKTRRAAKMNSLRIDHPDIKEFIEAKANEEKKIDILINNGIDSREAVDSVHYQNANFSVRLTDDFMKAVENNSEWQTIPIHNKELSDKMPKYKAKDLFRKIAEGTHACGDPGVQYHDTINKWHTCPNTEIIKASNPCSEYMFINDSSCNLASLNLRTFIDEKGKFDIKSFKEAIRTTVIAMDLNYDNSCFPTKEIAKNSHDYRPLGLGYANLGSLIMSLGLAYDSQEARDVAAGITSLMTATVYETSIEMAKKIGAFNGYEKNKDPMINVIKKHKDQSKKLEERIAILDNTGFNTKEIIAEANKTWDYDENNGGIYGFRNAQATVLAPTGTIGFMMDCDTLGIEPEIGLIQTKLLAEGGTLKRVNGTVPLALKRLGYNEKEINEVISYINENETTEGCKVLKEEHYAIFDCANKPKGKKRSIDYMGHIKMMAAVQPFLSGAISKTVNMPKEATVEDIENAYMQAWKLGLKAVAIYRDGSKSRQPLSFSKKGLEEKIEEEQVPVRKKLPNTRVSVTHKFGIAGHEGYLTAGLYENGKIGELFVTMSKEGTTIRGLMDSFATSISMNLQYGVPLDVLANKFKHQRFEPHGYVTDGDPEFVGREVDSIVDYIFGWLEKEFVNKKENNVVKEIPRIISNLDRVYNPEQVNVKAEVKKQEIKNIDSSENNSNSENGFEEDGGFCPVCGARMKRKGGCKEYCTKCPFIDPKGCSG